MTLRDGPVKGTYACKYAPLFLRAVIDTSGSQKDVLDDPRDRPASSERVHVYRRVGEASVVHLNMGRRKGTGFYASAEYEHMPDVDGEALRGTPDWRNWAALKETEGN